MNATTLSSRYLNISEVAGGADSDPAIRNVHVSPVRDGEFRVEATNGEITVCVFNRLNDQQNELFNAESTFFSDDDTKSILAKGKGRISILTDLEEEGNGHQRRATTVSTNDGTTIKLHNIADKYPDLSGYYDQNLNRPSLSFTVNRAYMARAAKIVSRMIEADNYTISFPLDSENAPIVIKGENPDNTFTIGMINPVVDMVSDPINRAKNIIKGASKSLEWILSCDNPDHEEKAQKAINALGDLLQSLNIDSANMKVPEFKSGQAIIPEVAERNNKYHEDNAGDDGDSAKVEDLFDDEEGDGDE